MKKLKQETAEAPRQNTGSGIYTWQGIKPAFFYFYPLLQMMQENTF